MNRILSLLVALLFAATLCEGQRTTVIVEIVNGRNNKPIRDRSVNVWLGDGGMRLLDTDPKGEIRLDVADIQPFKIRVNLNSRVDCRLQPGFRVEYSLDEILTKGLIGENACGKAVRVPAPGILVIYARPRTFWESFMI